MALFELTGNRLEATALGEPADASQRTTVLGAVHGQLVEVLRRPVFPVVWEREGEVDVLTALDAACQVMCVELLDHLDGAALVSAMARTAAAAQSGWGDLASHYPGGSTVFREDWEECRETVPVGVGPGPRLTLIAMSVDDDVRAALALLCAGIDVHEAQVRTTEEGRTLVALDPVRHDALDPLGGSGAVLVARNSRANLGLGGTRRNDEDERGPVADRTNPATVPVPSVRRTTRTSHSSRKEHASQTGGAPAVAAQTGGVRTGGAGGRVEAARARAAGPRVDRSRAGGSATAVAESETTGAIATASPDDVTAPSARLTRTPDTDADRNHRATAPVLGAQPTVPSGGQSAAVLASVAARIDTPVTLVWQRMRRGIHHEAVLSADGIITLSNGMRFRDPSAAANAAQHTQDMDGWRVWRIGAQGPALRDFIED